MRPILLICLALLSLVPQPAPAMSKAAVQPIPFSSEAIGVRTFRFIDQNRNRPVAVELWYPVSSSFPVSDESADAVWIHPREARDAPLPSGSRFPLILMSHGHKGDRRERSWLADTLVRQGYIVAAVEHFGNTWNQYNALLSMCFWERARDVSFTLDALLGDPSLAKILDPAKVGFVGYSLGGMTGLALAGAVAKNTRELARQKSQALAGEAVPPEAIGLFDFDAAERSYKEPRIHSMLLICPANFLYPPESLRQITIPVGLVAAINDEVLPYKEHAYQIIKHLVPHKLKLMRKEISHYTFLNRVTEAGRKILDKAIQNDPPCCDKASVHREVGIFAVEFFKETLK